MMKKHLHLMLMLSAAAVTTQSVSAEASQAWAMFGRDLQNTNHYPFETGSNYKQVWSVRIGCPAPGMSSTIVGDQATYNCSPCGSTGDTHAVALDGKKLWANGVGQGKRGIISTPCLHDGIVYYYDNDFIKAVDAGDGALKWKQEVTAGRVSISSPIIHGDKLHLVATEGVQIFALDRSKSAEDKVLPLEDAHGATSPAFHKGAMVVLTEKHVQSFDAKTYEENWKVELSMGLKERLIHSPVIDAKNDRIFVVSSKPYDPEGQLRCLNFTDGKQVWQQNIPGAGIRPSVAFDGKSVYVAALDGSIGAYDAQDGKQLWTWSLPGEVRNAEGKLDLGRQAGGLISTSNKLVFSTRSTLYIISNDKPQGIDWEYDLKGFGTPTPAFHDGDLYFRHRSKQEGASNYRFTEVKQAAAELEVKIIKSTAHIRNLGKTKLNFFQFCYGINVNEKQNCVLYEAQLQPGEETELDLSPYLPADEKVNHLLFSVQYEKPDGEGEFHHYYTINSGATGE